MRILSSLIVVAFLGSASIGRLLGFVDVAFGNARRAVIESPLDRNTAAAVSNVLKTKHDTVKNSIGNIR